MRTGRQSLTLNNKGPKLKHIDKVGQLYIDPLLDNVK